MSAEQLAAIYAVALSLLFSYVPGLSAWYGGLDKAVKQTIMGALLVVIAVTVYTMACAGFAGDFGLSVTCDRAGAISLFNVLVSALVANQATYLITKK